MPKVPARKHQDQIITTKGLILQRSSRREPLAGRHLGYPGGHRPLVVLAMSCSLMDGRSGGRGGKKGGKEGDSFDFETPSALSSQIASLCVTCQPWHVIVPATLEGGRIRISVGQMGKLRARDRVKGRRRAHRKKDRGTEVQREGHGERGDVREER